MGDRIGLEFDFTRGWPFEPVNTAKGISTEELRLRQKALSRAPLFSHLSSRRLRALAKATAVHEYKPDTAIVKEGARGQSFFVILEGKVKVVIGSRTVARLAAGQFFGELSLLDGDPRNASVIAETETTCLNLSGTPFTHVLNSEPGLAVTLLREVARRLRVAEAPPAG